MACEHHELVKHVTKVRPRTIEFSCPECKTSLSLPEDFFLKGDKPYTRFIALIKNHFGQKWSEIASEPVREQLMVEDGIDPLIAFFAS